MLEPLSHMQRDAAAHVALGEAEVASNATRPHESTQAFWVVSHMQLTS